MTIHFESFAPESAARNPNAPTDCTICLQPLTDRDSTAHKAGQTWHAFHTDCLTTWLDRNPVCPICKERVDSINGQSLSLEAPSQHPLTATYLRLAALFLIGLALIFLGAGLNTGMILLFIIALGLLVTSCPRPHYFVSSIQMARN